MDSDAKLQILIEALSAAGASALAIDGRGGVVISTMSDAALEQDIAAFVSERLARVGDGARLVMGHEGVRLSLTVRPTAKERGALWVVVAHEVRAAATHAGIEWLNADEVEARYASSTYGIVETRRRSLPPYGRAMRAGCPLCSRASWARGRIRLQDACTWMDPMPISPLCPLHSMSLRIAAGAICSKVPNRRYSKRG
ncbi:MAG: hypothetical protein U0J28_08900 [Collinsella sp.]|nr:hypothetical protein [Collinsella sp.]